MTSSTTHVALSTLLGIAAVLLGAALDGFVRGLLQGAGVALILIGVYLLSARRRSDARRWLPSRDEGDR